MLSEAQRIRSQLGALARHGITGERVDTTRGELKAARIRAICDEEPPLSTGQAMALAGYILRDPDRPARDWPEPAVVVHPMATTYELLTGRKPPE